MHVILIIKYNIMSKFLDPMYQYLVTPRTLSRYDVSLLSFLDAKIHFVVILAIDEDCARHYL